MKSALAANTTEETSAHRVSRFYDNALTHMILLSQHLQWQSMETARNRYDHPQLRASFEPYISMLGEEGQRLSELADVLGITVQACNQSINRIEALGYIERRPDPRDRRAKLLTLTNRGRELIHHGYAATLEIDRQCQRIIGAKRLTQLKRVIARLSQQLAIPPLRTNQQGLPVDANAPLPGLLPRIGDFAKRRFHSTLITAADGLLREIHVQLLMQLGRQGATLKELSALQEVSVQAVFVVAKDLQAEGYIHPVPDALEPRQHRWKLTPRGEQLLHSAIDGIESLEEEFRTTLGQQKFDVLRRCLRELVEGFGLSKQAIEDIDLHKLAKRLYAELGMERTAHLARLLADQL